MPAAMQPPLFTDAPQPQPEQAGMFE